MGLIKAGFSVSRWMLWLSRLSSVAKQGMSGSCWVAARQMLFQVVVWMLLNIYIPDVSGSAARWFLWNSRLLFVYVA